MSDDFIDNVGCDEGIVYYYAFCIKVILLACFTYIYIF